VFHKIRGISFLAEGISAFAVGLFSVQLTAFERNLAHFLLNKLYCRIGQVIRGFRVSQRCCAEVESFWEVIPCRRVDIC